MSAATALAHTCPDTQPWSGERSNLPLQTNLETAPKDGPPAAEPLQQSTVAHPVPIAATSAADALLLIYADAVDALEDARKSIANQVQALTTEMTIGPKGGVFGKSMGNTPEAARLQGLVDGLKALEHGAELELKRALRTHPLGPWVARTIGVGEKQGARLLAAIGDPAERRTVSQLWAYCGYHVLHPGHPVPDTQADVAGVDPSSDTGQEAHAVQHIPAGVAPKRKRGEQNNWNGTAKSRAFLIARKCVMCDGKPDKNGRRRGRSPYRDKYDERRAHTATTHPEWSDGHSHNDGLRIVAKEVLKDLWIEARRVQVSA